MGWEVRIQRLIPIFFLMLLAATPIASAANDWYETLPIWMGISLTISATVIGLGYMAAKLFQVQVLEAWAKLELQELAASAFIAVFCIALIASVNASAQFLVGDTSGDIVTFARENFLRDKVYTDGATIYSMMGQVYFNVAKYASYAFTAGLSLGVMSFSYSQSPASGLFPLAAQVGQGMDSVSSFMLLAVAQSAFLLFFQNAAAIFLPVGIFLRSFSFTRKIGGVVLAGVIATSVIYPAGFMVSREVYDTFSPEMMSTVGIVMNGDSSGHEGIPKATNPPSTSIVCNPFMQTVVQSPIPFVGGETGWDIAICSFMGPYKPVCQAVIYYIFLILKALYPIIMYFAVLLPAANDMMDAGLPAKFFTPLADYALPAVTKYAVLSTVVFLIPIIITMTMVRNLAITFGGEPQLYGLSKLV